MQGTQVHTNRPTGSDVNAMLFVRSPIPDQREDLLQGPLESQAFIEQSHSDTGNDALMSWFAGVLAKELHFPAEITPLRTYRMREIVWRDRRLALRDEIECSIVRDDDLYVIEYRPLGIRAYADSLPAAKDAFHEEFVVIWEDFGLAADEALAPGGVKLKQRLLGLVRGGTSSDEA